MSNAEWLSVQKKSKPKTVRGIFARATIGAKTSWGGEVITASSKCKIRNMAFAFVGDTIRYTDGTEAKISSGAGTVINDNGNVVAILGSHIDNGDYICWTPDAGASITVFEDEPLPEGFLVKGWSHPKPAQNEKA